MKKTRKNLVLNKETIRGLVPQELTHVLGGLGPSVLRSECCTDTHLCTHFCTTDCPM